MFITIADIDLFRLSSVHDFVKHCFVSIDQIKQLFDDSQGKPPLPVQLEQFVLDHILRSNSKTFLRETFRDESLIDLYTSFLSDLLQWPTLTHQQIVCILTLIQGLLCQIERTADEKHMTKLNEAFIHACSILMSGNDQKRSVLFSSQQYPKVIDYIVQTILQHRHLYQILLDEKPQQIETIEETRTIDFHVFEEPLFPYPLTEALPLSVYQEIILQIPPSPTFTDTTDPNQLSRESLDETNLDLNGIIDSINHQYPQMTREQIRQMFVEVAQVYLSEHNQDIQHQLREKELSLLSKFRNLDRNE